MKIMSLFTHLHVVPKQFDFLFKKENLSNLWDIFQNNLFCFTEERK